MTRVRFFRSDERARQSLEKSSGQLATQKDDDEHTDDTKKLDNSTATAYSTRTELTHPSQKHPFDSGAAAIFFLFLFQGVQSLCFFPLSHTLTHSIMACCLAGRNDGTEESTRTNRPYNAGQYQRRYDQISRSGQWQQPPQNRRTTHSNRSQSVS